MAEEKLLLSMGGKLLLLLPLPVLPGGASWSPCGAALCLCCVTATSELPGRAAVVAEQPQGSPVLTLGGGRRKRQQREGEGLLLPHVPCAGSGLPCLG